MTIDKAIELLQAAKARMGGNTTVWIRTSGMATKWEEECVEAITPLDDGESRYVRITSIPESDGC